MPLLWRKRKGENEWDIRIDTRDVKTEIITGPGWWHRAPWRIQTWLLLIWTEATHTWMPWLRICLKGPSPTSYSSLAGASYQPPATRRMALVAQMALITRAHLALYHWHQLWNFPILMPSIFLNGLLFSWPFLRKIPNLLDFISPILEKVKSHSTPLKSTFFNPINRIFVSIFFRSTYF